MCAEQYVFSICIGVFKRKMKKEAVFGISCGRCKWKDIWKCWHFFCTSIAEEIHHTMQWYITNVTISFLYYTYQYYVNTKEEPTFSGVLSQGNDTFKSWKINKSVSFQICFVTKSQLWNGIWDEQNTYDMPRKLVILCIQSWLIFLLLTKKIFNL